MTVVAALTQPIILSYVKGNTHSFFSKGMFLLAKIVFLPCFTKYYPIKQAKGSATIHFYYLNLVPQNLQRSVSVIIIRCKSCLAAQKYVHLWQCDVRNLFLS